MHYSTVTQKPKILFIEGEKALGDFLAVMFRYEGFELVALDMGQENLSLEEYTDIDLVMLNALGAKTQAVCQNIRTHSTTSTLPLVMVIEEHEDIAELCPADAYVTKPFALNKNEPIATIRTRLPQLLQHSTLFERWVTPFDMLGEDRLS